MKKLLPLCIALFLFVCTCLGLDLYYKNEIITKKENLIYYRTDLKSSNTFTMAQVLEKGAIPVFGSSELSAADEVAYPVELFHNGNSDFNMVLVGRGSMQSLHHAINVGGISELISGKKVVLIVSPQWFTPSHLSSEAYASRFSESMYIEFLKNDYISKDIKQKVTARIKPLLETDRAQLKRVENYEKMYIDHNLNLIKRLEVSLYDCFINKKQIYTLGKEALKMVPNSNEQVTASEISFEDLMVRAEQAGKDACTNNSLYIYDEYYDTYVKASEKENENSASSSSYLDSPEYEDFRLFLEICKETGIKPLIVNIPVNGRWYDWTGFPTEDRQAYYQKIRDICAEYNAEIADFSSKEYEPYFLKDIMHLGWKGWVYLDEAVYKFYKGE